MKTRFTRATLAIILVSFLFIGCSKNKDSNYYVKFKLDGNWITWTSVLGELGPDLADDSKTDFGLSARSSDQKQALDISFQVDGPQITPGTYNSDEYFMPWMYVKNANTPDTKFYSDDYVDGMGDPYFTVTITSITDKEITGSFTGNYLADISDDATVAITEGTFVIPRIR